MKSRFNSLSVLQILLWSFVCSSCVAGEVPADNAVAEVGECCDPDPIPTTPLCRYYGNCWASPYDNSIATFYDPCCDDECEQEDSCYYSDSYAPYANSWFEASFKYFCANQNGLNKRFKTPKIERSVTGPVINFDLFDQTVLTSHFDPRWDFGFGIAAGHNFKCYGFGVGFSWVHLKNNCDGKLFDHLTRWKLNYDTVDLDFTVKLNALPCMTLIPFGGIRLALINELTRIVVPIDLPFISFFQRLPKTAQKYAATGPRVGLGAEFLQTEWPCGFSFKMCASVAGNCLYGVNKFKIYNNILLKELVSQKRRCSRFNSWQGAVDASLAAYVSTLGLTFGLGAEYHRFFDMQGIFGNGDLQVCGGNASVSVNF